MNAKASKLLRRMSERLQRTEDRKKFKSWWNNLSEKEKKGITNDTKKYTTV